MQKATFGAGCFWGVQVAFQRLPGVLETIVGYEGGTLESPTYKDVCTDRTGHAEVVELTFDPEKITYPQLLDAFFSMHDPTQSNRQGPDRGTQYRSVVFYHSPGQQQAALDAIARLTREKKFPRPIVTEVVPAQRFWPAEDYHQKYLEKRGLASCHL
jgi:peptide-methionine (S)-S-oxide reductase